VAVDPSLIGGVRVKVGDEVLDTSVRAPGCHASRADRLTATADGLKN
jgi:hypothetical protein